MSEKLPWFQFYATDWISDEKVRLLSGRQRGWYIDLLAHDWQEGGIPDSVRLAQNLTSFREDYAYEEAFLSDDSGDWRTALDEEFEEVFGFFSPNGDGRRSHKRLRGQREHILLKSAKQREGALLTNAKRKSGIAKRNANRSAHRNGKRALSDALSVAVSGIEPEPELDRKTSIEQASSIAAVAEKLRIDRPRAAAAACSLAATQTELTDPGLAACALALDLVPREHLQRRQCELALMEAHDRIAAAAAPKRYAERIVQDILRRANGAKA